MAGGGSAALSPRVPTGFPALSEEPGAAPRESVSRRHPPVVSEEDLSVESSASQDGVPRAAGDSSATRRSPPAREGQAWQGGPEEAPCQQQQDRA